MSTSDNVQFYADYYSYVAEAGLERARSLFGAISISTKLDLSTVPVARNSRAANANLTKLLDMAYESLWTDGQDTQPIRRAFDSLSQYILSKSGLSLDSYLSSEGILVTPLFARLSERFGRPIDESNIES